MDEEKVDQAIRYAHDSGADEGYDAGYEDGHMEGYSDCMEGREPEFT